MTDITLNTITSGYNISKINDNFDKIQSNINTDAIKKSGGNNVMDQDLDLNSNDLLNVNTVSATSVKIGGVAVVPGDTLAIPPGTIGSTEINPSYDATLTHVDDLASTDTGKGAELVGYLTGTVKSFLDSLFGDLGATFIKYKASFTGAVQRTLGAVAEDEINSEWWAPDRTGTTDASAKLQMALDAAAGLRLTIRPGTYLIGTALQVSSNTTVSCYGATFKRIGTADNIIRNKADGTTGGTSANSNIKVLGGTWDANYGTYTTDMTVITFGHANDIVIRDAKIINGTKYHHIEINSSDNVLIEGCKFINGNTQAGNGTEAIQIDSADNSGQFPWFGPYDNTTCNNIKIRKNVFLNCGTGVGTHSDPTHVHTLIDIDGNVMSGTQYAGVRIHGWSGVKIRGNHISNGVYGIIGDVVTGMAQNDIRIIGNTFTGIGAVSTYSTTTGKVIYLNSLPDGSAGFNSVSFSSNAVSNSKNTPMNHGCSFTYCKEVTITGNTVRDTNGVGITAYGGSYIAITGNEVISTISDNIKLGGSGIANDVFRAVVSGNVCNTLNISDSALTVVTGNNVSNTITTANNAATVHIEKNLVNTTWA